MDVSELELQELYTWVDEVPLSRPKRNIARDFSDGVLMAEIVAHYFPKLVELHNYSSANATGQKMYNWNTLNQKVFKRLGFTLSKQEFEAVSACQAGSIERILKLVRVRINKCREEGFTGVSTGPTMVPAGAAVVTTLPAGRVPGMELQGGGGAGVKESPHGGYMAAPAYPTAQQQPQHQAMPPRSNHQAPAVAHHHPGAMGAPQAVPKGAKSGAVVPAELLADRDQIIMELRETNEILETKVRKLEQLVRLKDAKISTLMAKLQSANLA